MQLLRPVFYVFMGKNDFKENFKIPHWKVTWYKAIKSGNFCIEKIIEIKNRLTHTQLNVCEKEELPCFLYLIQIFACGEEESLEKKVERIIGQMWVSPYQFILDIEQLRWGVTMHQWQLLMAFLSKEVGRYALELLQ